MCQCCTFFSKSNWWRNQLSREFICFLLNLSKDSIHLSFWSNLKFEIFLRIKLQSERSTQSSHSRRLCYKSTCHISSIDPIYQWASATIRYQEYHFCDQPIVKISALSHHPSSIHNQFDFCQYPQNSGWKSFSISEFEMPRYLPLPPDL